jgi:hypothetical protein
LSEDDANDILSKVDNDMALMSAIAAKLPQPTDPQLVMGLAQAAKNIASKGDSALWDALAATVDPFLSNDEVQKGISQYGQGIEMMQNAQVVGPALGKAAQVVGSQINVDPKLLASAFQMKMNEKELTRLITSYVSGGQETNYDRNLRKLGYAELDKPETMSFYLKDFESKEAFMKFIDDYNDEMKENGEREWVDSYTSKYSVQYAMKIFYCNLMHWNFFDLNRLEAAHKVLKMSESMRSITIEHEGHLYICTAKPGTTVIEGIGNSRFDYRPFKPK